MLALPITTGRSFALTARGRTLQALDTPIVRAAAAEFTSGFEEGTLRFFDAVLPDCDRMIDCGAFIGFTALYAATQVADVHAFEPSPTNFGFLEANLALNPALAARVHPVNHALGTHDGHVTLFGKAIGDSGTSLFREVQRAGIVHGTAEATVPMRDAAAALAACGVDRRTLIKLDIEGAEYDVVPTLGPLIAATKPFVHVSFHPFNIVIGADEYVNSVARLSRALAVAAALAHYRYMYVYTADGWTCIDAPARPYFLRHYLLTPKPVPRVATPQYGFTDAVAFSDVLIAGLGEGLGAGLGTGARA